MLLKKISVRNFRCFEAATLELDAELNWIIGQNASGKTSLLEALFFLGHGRSFRSNRPDRLIQEGADSFELVAWLSSQQREQVLGIRRDKDGTLARLGGQTLKGMAQAAQALPVVVLDSGMSELVTGGPGERRRWLDWGVFHVEQDFLPAWREYQQALRQRNEGLKAGLGERSLSPWTQAVAKAGDRLAALRRGYFQALLPVIGEYLHRAIPTVQLEATLRQGWAEDENLLESLERHVQKDREFGNTRRGPHRADIQLKVGGLPAEERLSRGQQKMLAGALWLAQVQVFTRRTGQQPLLLVDDLAAELDGEHLERFLELLKRQQAQLVLTAIADNEIVATGLTGGRVFHVEHGLLGA